MLAVEISSLCILALCAALKWRAGALRPFLRDVLLIGAAGWMAEDLCIRLFEHYGYAQGWTARLDRVPLLVGIIWPFVILSAADVARQLWGDSRWLPLQAAALIAFDAALVEPVAVRAGLWRWTPPGPWLEVPIGNFVGWGVIVGAYAYGAARWAGTGALAIQAGRRIALAAACILALVLVGAAWTSLGLERAFAHGRGWAVWTAVLMATCWRMRGGTRAGGVAGSSLPELLAGTPGRGPVAALGVVGLAFFGEAVRVGDPRVTVAAAGSLAALAFVTAANLRRRAP